MYLSKPVEHVAKPDPVVAEGSKCLLARENNGMPLFSLTIGHQGREKKLLRVGRESIGSF